MNARRSAEFSLAHRLEVSRIAEHLVPVFGCDSWYVVCHREHQFVIHLAQAGTDRYAVSFECTNPADKGIYHGSLTSHFSLIPLDQGDEIPEAKFEEVKAGLTHLASGSGVHVG
jgi:hypothetical protein